MLELVGGAKPRRRSPRAGHEGPDRDRRHGRRRRGDARPAEADGPAGAPDRDDACAHGRWTRRRRRCVRSPARSCPPRERPDHAARRPRLPGGGGGGARSTGSPSRGSSGRCCWTSAVARAGRLGRRHASSGAEELVRVGHRDPAQDAVRVGLVVAHAPERGRVAVERDARARPRRGARRGCRSRRSRTAPPASCRFVCSRIQPSSSRRK